MEETDPKESTPQPEEKSGHHNSKTQFQNSFSPAGKEDAKPEEEQRLLSSTCTSLDDDFDLANMNMKLDVPERPRPVEA